MISLEKLVKITAEVIFILEGTMVSVIVIVNDGNGVMFDDNIILVVMLIVELKKIEVISIVENTSLVLFLTVLGVKLKDETLSIVLLKDGVMSMLEVVEFIVALLMETSVVSNPMVEVSMSTGDEIVCGVGKGDIDDEGILVKGMLDVNSLELKVVEKSPLTVMPKVLKVDVINVTDSDGKMLPLMDINKVETITLVSIPLPDPSSSPSFRLSLLLPCCCHSVILTESSFILKQ